MEIYFGPVRNVPSWYWVGQDIAEFLSSRHQIRYFRTVADIPSDAAVFWVKCPLENGACAEIEKKRLRIAFFPVDTFLSDEHFAKCQQFIDACRLIVVHSRSLAHFFPRQRVHFVDHYNKYGISSTDRRPDRTLLWIGGFQYFPYVFRYVLEHKLHAVNDIIYLTDSKSPNGIAAANRLGKELGLGWDFSDMASLSDFSVVEWSESVQHQLLTSCRGAFDCKDSHDFNQVHKPPTKLQKFVCSNIPCAINSSSTLRSSMGFEVCDILDQDRWFSRDYQLLIEEFGHTFRTNFSLSAIGNKYLQFAEEILTDHVRG